MNSEINYTFFTEQTRYKKYELLVPTVPNFSLDIIRI